MTTNQKTGITGVRTVSIPVTDQDRALAFYVDTLGFEKRLDVPFVHVWTVEDGKAVRFRQFLDTAGWVEALRPF